MVNSAVACRPLYNCDPAGINQQDTLPSLSPCTPEITIAPLRAIHALNQTTFHHVSTRARFNQRFPNDIEKINVHSPGKIIT